MMVWPDSSSVRTRNVGSSCARRLQRHAHLFLVGLGLRLDRDVNHRLRKLHLLERDDLIGVAQRVARRVVLQTHGRSDVAGAHFLDLFALVRVHLQDPADPLLAALDRVVHRVARVHHARIDAEERELPDERVGHDLERQRGERLFVVRRTLCFGCPLSLEALDRRHVDGRRHVIDDRIEHRLHAFVLERRAAQHRENLAVERTLRSPCLISASDKLTDSRVLVHELFVRLGGGLDHFLTPLVPLRRRVRRGCRAPRISCPGSIRPSRSLSS